MNAKHQTKNVISHKFVFLAAGIAIAIIAAFSICATTQVRAAENSEGIANGAEWTLRGNGGFWEIQSKIYEMSFQDSNVTWHDNFWDDKDNVQDKLESYLSNDVIVYQIRSGDTWELRFLISGGWLSIWPEDCDESIKWTCPDFEIPIEGSIGEPVVLDPNKNYTFFAPGFSEGTNITGIVTNADNHWQPVSGAFVQYCQWSPWFWDYVPVPEMSTFTDWFGNYTIEGITEDMLPGVIRVYRFGYDVAESWPIWGAPEGSDTIYRFIEMAPSEPPVPPVPPTPPDPPVPPVPPQPDPPQPVPPTPVPTPVNPGGGIAQTGDATPFTAVAVLAIVAALGCGVALRKEV